MDASFAGFGMGYVICLVLVEKMCVLFWRL